MLMGWSNNIDLVMGWSKNVALMTGWSNLALSLCTTTQLFQMRNQQLVCKVAPVLAVSKVCNILITYLLTFFIICKSLEILAHQGWQQ
jgi:hypothetical protein